MKWYDAKVCSPSTSREVLVARVDFDRATMIQNVPYSAKFNAFNVRDESDDADTAIDVDYWADMLTVEEILHGE